MKSIFRKKDDQPSKIQASLPDGNKTEAITATPRTGNLFGLKSLGNKSKSDSQDGLKQKTKSG